MKWTTKANTKLARKYLMPVQTACYMSGFVEMLTAEAGLIDTGITFWRIRVIEMYEGEAKFWGQREPQPGEIELRLNAAAQVLGDQHELSVKFCGKHEGSRYCVYDENADCFSLTVKSRTDAYITLVRQVDVRDRFLKRITKKRAAK